MSIEAEKKFDLDLLIQQIGPFGKFQLINYLLICIPIIFTGMFSLGFAFTAGNLDYRCRISGCDGDDPSLSAPFLDFTTPKDGDKFSSCQKFLHTPNATITDQCQADLFDPTQLRDCAEFVYQDDETTILSEWDLGCSEEWKLSFVGTISQLGYILGQPVTGYYSDKFGRRTALVIGGILAVILGITRSFSVNYIMFIILEFLSSFACSGVYNSGFILGLELVGPERRSLGVFYINAFYAVGEALLGFLAMLTKDWRFLLRITYAPAILILIYRWLIPESVRWLVTMNRPRAAAKIIDSAAKMNKSQLTPEAQKMLSEAFYEDCEIFSEKENNAEDVEECNPFAALKSRTLLLRFLNCLFCWFSIYFVFFGLTLNSVVTVGNKYLNFILNCLIEVPAAAICCLAMDKFGRRFVVCVSLIFSGIACLAYIFITSDVAENVNLALFLFGKFSITMAIITIYVYTAELFPTKLRLTFLSVCATFGNIGAMLAPFTLLLGKYFESLPMILFVAVAIPAGILILLSPETLNHTLPDTIQEAENIGRKRGKRKINLKTAISQLSVSKEVAAKSFIENGST
ncbi:organic cation transporter protein-like [Lutzomyia longipalpis]|uniref:organic cation transporter protein-like n=1 Tax=Lutzomyia longipalpis TaxID=7200 RepID=UPI00248405DB|nr:organic cation transporter protein-like [Lutzomyia longipalpis]